MALIAANASRLGSSLNRTFSGVTNNSGGHHRANIGVPHTHLNWSAGDHRVAGVTDKAGVPDGARHPVAWKQPRKGGAMSARFMLLGSATLSGSGAAGLNAVADLTGYGTIEPSAMQLVVSAIAALAGSGTINTAALAGSIEAQSALGGAGDLTGAIGALAGLFADIGGLGTLAATIRATGAMQAAVTPFTELSPQSLAAAVWAKVIESGFTAEEVMRLLTAQAAGDAAGLGGPVTVFKSLDGTKTRIEGTIAAGARTITTRDGG